MTKRLCRDKIQFVNDHTRRISYKCSTKYAAEAKMKKLLSLGHIVDYGNCTFCVGSYRKNHGSLPTSGSSVYFEKS